MSIAPSAANSFAFENLDTTSPAVHGSILTRDASNWTDLPAGTAGFFLRSNGPGADLTYVALPGGGDMLVATYDPGGKVANAFDFAEFQVAAEVRGDIVTRGVSAWGRLPAGVSGRFLQSQGPGNDLVYAVAPGNMLTSVYDPAGKNASAFNYINMSIASEAPADLITRGTGAWERLAGGSLGQALVLDPTTLRPKWGAQLPANHADALNLSVPTAATIEITAGRCRSDDDTFDLVVGSPITVDITVSGVGGLDTGSEAASTWYDVYVIGDLAGAVDGLLVVQGDVPVVFGSHPFKRRVGVARNDGSSNFLAFQQSGKARLRVYNWLLSTAVTTVLSGGSATTPTVVALGSLVSPTSQSAFIGVLQGGGTIVDIHQTVAGPPLYNVDDDVAFIAPTDASQQIAYSNQGGGGSVDILVHGFFEDI